MLWPFFKVTYNNRISKILVKIRTPYIFKCCATVLLCLSSSPLWAHCIDGDCQNGKGTFLFPGGSRYVGEWENGQMDGNGEFISSSGEKYAGYWVGNSLVRYVFIKDKQYKPYISAAVDTNYKSKEVSIADRIVDQHFDPSTDLPPTAAGPSSFKHKKSDSNK